MKEEAKETIPESVSAAEIAKQSEKYWLQRDRDAEVQPAPKE